MLNRVWTIGAATLTVVSVVTLFAIRPELASNPNIWVVIMAAAPGLFATLKAEESAKQAKESVEETKKAREEMKNGTMTKVIRDAVSEILEENGIAVAKKGNTSLPTKRTKGERQ